MLSIYLLLLTLMLMLVTALSEESIVCVRMPTFAPPVVELVIVGCQFSTSDPPAVITLVTVLVGVRTCDHQRVLEGCSTRSVPVV